MTDIWPITFDARKIAFRQSKDGIVISLVVHPNSDCIAVLAAAPISFDFQVTLCPMTESPAGEPQERRTASQAPAGVKAPMTLSQKAGMLADELRFQVWASKQIIHGTPNQPKTAKEYIYLRCGISSLKELNTDDYALIRYQQMLNEFQTWAQDNPL